MWTMAEALEQINAIILENSIVRSFKVNKYSVVYDDNEIKTFSPPFSQLPDSDFLQNKFTNEELGADSG